MGKNKKYDFSGWATKNDLKCSDGRTIKKNAFVNDDGKVVPLVWQHQHNTPENVLGHALLENRSDGVYAYCTFNSTPQAQHAKELVQHGDIKSLSIHANKLKQNGGKVLHGVIREVSLVLAGANPGAMIDFPILQHSDGSIEEALDEAFIYTGVDITSISHSDDEDDFVEDRKNEKDKTVEEVFNTFTEEQKNLLYYLIGKVTSDEDEEEEVEHSEEDGKTIKEIFDSLTEEQKNVLYFLVAKAEEMKNEDDEKKVEHSDEGGNDFMTHNVFENETPKNYTLTHDDMMSIIEDAKRKGSLKKSIEDFSDTIEHSIENIDYLFPENAQLVTGEPGFIARQNTWVNVVMNGVHKSPFARIKTAYANITENDARAKGYIKGNQKKEEVFGLLKRVTTPQTIYKLQKLDRDDVVDITDFDVIAWIKKEMKLMLDEEVARAVLISDGRQSGEEDRINPENIRPIWNDDDFFTIKKKVKFEANDTNAVKADKIIESVLRARKNYKGSGSPEAFFDPDTLTTLLLAKDTTGRRIYKSVDELAAALRVTTIHEVPVFENAKRTDSKDSKKYTPLCIIVNLDDYNIGADKGGQINMFDDFDIDFNKYSYLIETRCSGALIRPYSAIVVEQEVE